MLTPVLCTKTGVTLIVIRTNSIETRSIDLLRVIKRIITSVNTEVADIKTSEATSITILLCIVITFVKAFVIISITIIEASATLVISVSSSAPPDEILSSKAI